MSFQRSGERSHRLLRDTRPDNSVAHPNGAEPDRQRRSASQGEKALARLPGAPQGRGGRGVHSGLHKKGRRGEKGENGECAATGRPETNKHGLVVDVLTG